jgi:hypothetical protein
MRTRSSFSSSVSLSSLLVLSVALTACNGDDDGTSPDDSGAFDATTSDAGGSDSSATDAPVSLDSSATDSSKGGGEMDSTATADASDGGAEADTGARNDGDVAMDSGASDAQPDADDAATSDAGDAASPQVLLTTVDPGVTATAVVINQGTAIGEGAANGATPVSLTNVAADGANSETITSDMNPFERTGHVPDTAAGFCDYPADGGAPTRHSYVTGAKFETFDAGVGTDPWVTMAPYYFPLVYTSTNTPTGNATGGKPPILGLFDWRPKDIDEAVVVAESDDNGLSWFFMQTVLELNPDYSNPASGGYVASSTDTGCPSAITGTNANFTSVNGATADDGWGHATIVQLPGLSASEGQYLYLLDRNTANMPGTSMPYVDNAPLHVIHLTESSNKFPLWNTNQTNNDIKSISSALVGTPDAAAPVTVVNSSGLLNPDGIMAVFPTAAGADAGTEVTVLYVQKIVNGDTSFPAAEQCTKAPVSGKTNHDISNVRLATTTDGVNFTDLGIVNGLNDPHTVDYNGTRWVSPRGTLIDILGDGSRWGLYFSAGNCLDGDSDAFHYIGYAESSDKVNWTVYNDINHPIASINTITTANQAGGAMVTIPANTPVFPTEYWFAERLYAPTAVRIDATHLSMTFASYGVQTPSADYLDYRQIGNVVLTVSQALPATTPNNINAH